MGISQEMDENVATQALTYDQVTQSSARPSTKAVQVLAATDPSGIPGGT
jgi:hypothetical protein